MATTNGDDLGAIFHQLGAITAELRRAGDDRIVLEKIASQVAELKIGMAGLMADLRQARDMVSGFEDGCLERQVAIAALQSWRTEMSREHAALEKRVDGLETRAKRTRKAIWASATAWALAIGGAIVNHLSGHVRYEP